MANTRTQQWRNTKRAQGLKAVTAWLTTEEELRLKDLAAAWHCSPSAIMQQALAQFHPGRPPSLSNDTVASQPHLTHDTDISQRHHSDVPDSSQIQAYLKAKLPALVRGIVEQLALDMLLTGPRDDDVAETEDEEGLDAAASDAPDDVQRQGSDVTNPLPRRTRVDTEARQIQSSDGAKTPPQRHSNATDTPEDATYDTTRYRLGKLCPRQHTYSDTGQSLRYRKSKRCIQCDTEDAQARREARKRQT